jgi:methyl-accepting chemotaxis protein
MSEAVSEAAKSVGSINNHWQIIYTVVICISAVVGLWILNNRQSKESKALVDAQGAAEKAATEARKAERDKQISDIEHRFMMSAQELSKRVDGVSSVAEGVGKSLDRHFEEHKTSEERMQKTMEQVNNKLCDLYEKVNAVNIGVVKMATLLEERAKRDHV